MRRKRPNLLQRKPIFLGCEGRSEVGYGAFLSGICRDVPEPRVAITVQPLQPGAGDPLELVERALQKVVEFEERRVPFAFKAVLIDPGQQRKTAEAAARAEESGLLIIWQRQDHEAFLLRHLPTCQSMRPGANRSLFELRRHWPNYHKGMSAHELGERIGLADIRRAAIVEAELRSFLVAIGLL